MPIKYLQLNYFLGENERLYGTPHQDVYFMVGSARSCWLCRALIQLYNPYSLKSSMRNLVCPDAQTGHQTTVYSSQCFKFNENTKMYPLLPSPSSPSACTQAYTICKCCSDSLISIRTSREWVNNCSTSLSSTALVSSALSSVYGQQLFGRQQFKAAPSISGTSPLKNWAKDIPDHHHLFAHPHHSLALVAISLSFIWQRLL